MRRIRNYKTSFQEYKKEKYMKTLNLFAANNSYISSCLQYFDFTFLFLLTAWIAWEFSRVCRFQDFLVELCFQIQLAPSTYVSFFVWHLLIKGKFSFLFYHNACCQLEVRNAYTCTCILPEEIIKQNNCALWIIRK